MHEIFSDEITPRQVILDGTYYHPTTIAGMVDPVKVHEVYLDSCDNQEDSKCPLILGSDQTLLINMTATVVRIIIFWGAPPL